MLTLSRYCVYFHGFIDPRAGRKQLLHELLSNPWAPGADKRNLRDKGKDNEENISTEQNQKSTYARIPVTDGYHRRQAGHQQTTRQRPQTFGPVVGW